MNSIMSDGKTIIYVGRNNLQNELTLKWPVKKNLFHAATSLSHVVICGNLNPSDQQDRCSGASCLLLQGTPVTRWSDMIVKTQQANRWQTRFVTYTGQKTLRVTPDPENVLWKSWFQTKSGFSITNLLLQSSFPSRPSSYQWRYFDFQLVFNNSQRADFCQ